MNQVWRASIHKVAASTYKLIEANLGKAECERLIGFHSKCRREQYLLSRWLLRFALSHHHNQPFNRWRFSQQPNAAPVLDNPVFAPVHLSVSHSDIWVVVALSDQAVGVDIEHVKQRKHINQVAHRVFTPQQAAQFNQLEEVDALKYFYHLWTYKEALYKVQENANHQVQLVSTDPWSVDGYHCQSTEFDTCKLALVSEIKTEQFTYFEAIDQNNFWQIQKPENLKRGFPYD